MDMEIYHLIIFLNTSEMPGLNGAHYCFTILSIREMVKQLVKIMIISAALLAAICAAACAKDGESAMSGKFRESGTFLSVASVAGEWLEIKKALNTAHIEDFRQTVERFLASPVGSLYKVQRHEEMRTFEMIFPALEQLETAVIQEAVAFWRKGILVCGACTNAPLPFPAH
jgi:hypothetical protein